MSHRTLRYLRNFAAPLVLLAALAGCTQLDQAFAPSVPGVRDEWPQLLKEIRAFEREFGFTETQNFATVVEDHDQNPFCGYAPQFYLPYSYEDPAIRWRDAVSEQECLQYSDGGDVTFGHVEALGEVNAPVTPAIIASGVDRFIYLVIHEDCHDQFDLPWGIEEPLCELIAYKALPAFADRRFTWGSRAHRAVKRYAEQESRRAHATVPIYAELAAVYERYGRKQLQEDEALQERMRIFATAERTLARETGTMNNVALANDMTYARHYALMESVYKAMGGDIGRTVEFFRRVDKAKPSRAAVMKKIGNDDERSLAFIRAYESAVIDTVQQLLRERPAPKQP